MQAFDAPFFGAKYMKATESAPPFAQYDPLPLFRAAVTLEGAVRDGKIAIYSPGFCVCYINGRPVTEDVFTSPVSDYRKNLWYTEYDVTPLLHAGENVVAVIAGNGFLNESFATCWGFHQASWRDAPKCLLALTVNGECILKSGEGFRTSREHSHIVFSHLRSGERWDMRKFDTAWQREGYDDASWERAIACELPEGAVLRPTLCPPVRECESYEPVALTPIEGGCILDFGLTSSGYIDITVKAERDREILFRYAEELDEDLNPRHNGMDDPYFYPESVFMTDGLIASGGVDTFKPHFAFHGFRYVRVEGCTGDEILSVRAHFIHNDVKCTSSLSTGNEILNFIYTAGVRSTLSNLFWAMTDCPTREKFGWLNDAQATVEQALYNFDILPFYDRWYADVLAQMREDGALYGVVPTYGWGDDWGPGCDGFLFELPYRVWLFTGDDAMLRGAIPYFERYLTYLEREMAAGRQFLLADWTGSYNDPRIPYDYVRDFYYLKGAYITALACRLSGKEGPWGEKLKAAKEDYLSRYLAPSGECKIAEQSAVAMLLTPWLCEGDEILGRQLAAIVERDGYRLTTGMVGVQYLYGALSGAGRADLALRIITESEPGYKTWYESGATTLWEHWDGATHGSHNHQMFSGVIAWFYRGLLGIVPREDAPGFERLILRPSFVPSLGFIKAEFMSVRGKIKAEWTSGTDGFLYRVTLPKGIDATFDGVPLHEGENEFFIKA